MDLVVGGTGVLSVEIAQRLVEAASNMNECKAGN